MGLRAWAVSSVLSALLLSGASGQDKLPVVTPEQAIAELRRTLDAPLRGTGQPAPAGLTARMQQVPLRGLSIAVFHQGKLHWAQGFGEARAGVPVTPETRFQAGSISKAVAALGVLALAESRGVGLDDDLRPMLKRWQPAIETPAPDAPRYTLRRLLSHSAGLGQHGFPGYSRDGVLPTLAQILDGLPPANTGPVRPVQPAGQGFRYSGGGSTIVQLWVEDFGGESFATQMQQSVLQPLGLVNSQFEPPARADEARFAMSHQGREPQPGGARVYPERQAAGLWSTPTDIATALMAVQRAAAGQPSPVSAATARAVTTAQTAVTSLGFFIDGGKGPAQRFGHNGSNQGFESLATAFVNQGDGVVIMANGQNTWALMEALLRTLGRIYQWPGLAAPLALADQTLPPEAVRWVGTYEPRQGPAQQVRLHGAALWLTTGAGSWQRLWRTEAGAYATEFGQPLLRFTAQGVQAGDEAPLPRQALAPLRWPAVYLRGSLNNWQPTQALQAIGPGRWRLALDLPGGRHEFKLGDADWQAVDLGGTSNAAISLGAWTRLRTRGGNLVLDIPSSGRYQLELEVSDSPRPPRLRLSSAAGPMPRR